MIKFIDWLFLKENSELKRLRRQEILANQAKERQNAGLPLSKRHKSALGIKYSLGHIQVSGTGAHKSLKAYNRKRLEKPMSD